MSFNFMDAVTTCRDFRAPQNKLSHCFYCFPIYCHEVMGPVGLKLNIQKTKIMASGPVTSWEIDRETVETVSDIILGGPQITADGDCSHDIKRRLLLGRKVMTNIDSILKSRDITLPTRLWFFQCHV